MPEVPPLILHALPEAELLTVKLGSSSTIQQFLKMTVSGHSTGEQWATC